MSLDGRITHTQCGIGGGYLIVCHEIMLLFL